MTKTEYEQGNHFDPIEILTENKENINFNKENETKDHSKKSIMGKPIGTKKKLSHIEIDDILSDSNIRVCQQNLEHILTPKQNIVLGNVSLIEYTDKETIKDVSEIPTKVENFETSKECAKNPRGKNENGVYAETSKTPSNLEFYEEKSDIEHPEYDKVKNVVSNEERAVQKKHNVVLRDVSLNRVTDKEIKDVSEIPTKVENSETSKVENHRIKNENGVYAETSKTPPCANAEFYEEKRDIKHSECDKVKNLVSNEDQAVQKKKNVVLEDVSLSKVMYKENSETRKNVSAIPKKLENSKMSQECAAKNSRPKNGNGVLADVKNTKSSKNHLRANPEFYEEEKNDIEHPEWDEVKNLGTDEERYRQVRACWGSKKVPNPNRNLTHQSFRNRKEQILKRDSRKIKAHKRQASSVPDERKTKRSRTHSCTYLIDNKISATKAEMSFKTRQLQKNLKNRMFALEKDRQRQDTAIRNKSYHFFGYGYLSNDCCYELRQSDYDYQRRRSEINCNFQAENDKCLDTYDSELRELNKVKNETFGFYKFYKGLNDNADPTFLTDPQLQELNEMEDIYTEFDKHYHQ